MADHHSCEQCPVHHPGNLIRLGISVENADYVIALAGNPNTGKSTVFNRLTGLRQHTGNWPGKTVARAEGAFGFGEKRFKIVDLPGTYSLLSTSTDETVARDFILFGRPDVTVVVVDATRLERNLNLVLQVLEITNRVVVCLNLIDEAERHGIIIDERSLSKELGVPVVPTAARQGTGVPQLLQYIFDVATGTYECKPHSFTTHSKTLARAIERLTEQVQQEFPQIPNARWIALRLLEGDSSIIDAIQNGTLALMQSGHNEETSPGQRSTAFVDKGL